MVSDGGVWTVCRGTGKPGTAEEGKLGELHLEMSLSQARLAVMHWARHPGSWADVAERHHGDPNIRFAEFDWTFEQQPPAPVAHVAGMMMARQGVARQRCLWCGALLYEIQVDMVDFRRLASLLLPGAWYELPDGRPVTCVTGGEVRPLGSSADEVEPANACTRPLAPPDTGPDSGPGEVADLLGQTERMWRTGSPTGHPEVW